MKLAAYVCDQCGDGVDTDDPRWGYDGGEWAHACGETFGIAHLRRSPERDAAIADERAAIAAFDNSADAQGIRQRLANERRREETMRNLRKGGAI